MQKSKAKSLKKLKSKQPTGSSSIMKSSAQAVVGFFKQNWIGFAIILVTVSIFFWPILTRLDSYSEGGDPMFNAWTLARNHHCILQENCERYADGNIYYPNSDSMLYSETQFSAGLLTLPLHFINDNPIFSYNVWTIASFMFTGWFMYLLAKYLSKNNEYVSVAAALVFTFAPFKMAAVTHLQNLSIFYLPLAVLFVLRYIDTAKKQYLAGVFITLALLFNASWYNLVFAAAAVGLLVVSLFVTKFTNLRKSLLLLGTMVAALLTTAPLLLQYIHFSKTQNASFSIHEQTLYSSSVADYFLPHSGTALGKIIHELKPSQFLNGFNLDSFSYHGITLYILACVLLFIAYKTRKQSGEVSKNNRLVLGLGVVGFVGLLFSFGPLLKLTNSYFYGPFFEGARAIIPTPYFLLEKLLPQLSFIRAVGRWSVLLLFALVCLLALAPRYISVLKWSARKIRIVTEVFLAALAVELMPLHQVQMSKLAIAYNIEIPKVYEFIKEQQEVDNIIILNADYDYPEAPGYFARAEQVLWAGYHNKNIFNGYSGYTPPAYFEDFVDFVNFDKQDITQLKTLNVKYVLVDKLLMKGKPYVNERVSALLSEQVYSDERYSLYKLPQ